MRVVLPFGRVASKGRRVGVWMVARAQAQAWRPSTAWLCAKEDEGVERDDQLATVCHTY